MIEKDNAGETDIQVFDQPTATHMPLNLGRGELTIATIVGFDANGKPLLVYQNDPDTDAVSAISTVSLHSQHIARQVAVLFIDQDASQPVIVGLIKSHLDDLLESHEVSENESHRQAAAGQMTTGQITTGQKTTGQINTESAEQTDQNVYVDGKKIHIEAEDEIVLRCGESSITLTKSGKILIRGKYLLNRSSGVNRIMGGSVQVN